MVRQMKVFQETRYYRKRSAGGALRMAVVGSLIVVPRTCLNSACLLRLVPEDWDCEPKSWESLAAS